jgi:hypothetical protein
LDARSLSQQSRLHAAGNCDLLDDAIRVFEHAIDGVSRPEGLLAPVSLN